MRKLSMQWLRLRAGVLIKSTCAIVLANSFVLAHAKPSSPSAITVILHQDGSFTPDFPEYVPSKNLTPHALSGVEIGTSVTVADKYCKDYRKIKYFDCVLIFQEVTVGAAKKPTWIQGSQVIHLQLPKGYSTLGSDELECKYRGVSSQGIITIAKWVFRKKPGIGGFARDIRHAWIIDIKDRKFRAIDEKMVSCELNEER